MMSSSGDKHEQETPIPIKQTNLKGTDYVIIVTFYGCGRKLYLHVNEDCSYQNWTAGRLGGTTPV